MVFNSSDDGFLSTALPTGCRRPGWRAQGHSIHEGSLLYLHLSAAGFLYPLWPRFVEASTVPGKRYDAQMAIVVALGWFFFFVCFWVLFDFCFFFLLVAAVLGL